MVNNQINNLIEQLKKGSSLAVDHQEIEQFLNNCAIDSAPISLIVNYLLTTAQQQANELETNRQTI